MGREAFFNRKLSLSQELGAYSDHSLVLRVRFMGTSIGMGIGFIGLLSERAPHLLDCKRQKGIRKRA